VTFISNCRRLQEDDDFRKQFCRAYVKQLGYDPDERVSYAHPEGYAVALYRARWQAIESQLLDQVQLIVAIADF
jgi:ligand-binding sensor domain-containing protein